MTNRSHANSVFDQLARLSSDEGIAYVGVVEKPKPSGGDSGEMDDAVTPDAVDSEASDDDAGDAEAGKDESSDDEVSSAESSNDEASDAESSDDDAGKPKAARRTRFQRIRRRLAFGAAALALIGVLGGAALACWELKQSRDTEAAGQAALAVAKAYGTTLTSVDSKDIDGNFAKVVDGATGEFKDLYTRSSAQLRQLLIDNKAEAKGTVIDGAIKSATKTKVEVLLFIDQSITNSVNPTPRIDRNRVVMTLQLIDNRWLASNVDVT